MRSRLTCEEARELAPDLALGTISGDDRARLLSHVASCARCRDHVESLSETADAILLLAPEHEPPAGFESAVLSQSKAAGPRARGRMWIAAAAAACLAALAGAGAVLWASYDERETAAHYREALEEADGDYFGVKALRAEDGRKVANVFAYAGQTPWVFIVFEDQPSDGTYEVEVVRRGGEVAELGSFEGGERRTWGAELPFELRALAELRVSSPSGPLEALFPRS